MTAAERIGSPEAAVWARDEGLAGAVGITGHGHQAPGTHLEALRRLPFDTVLTPLNYVLGQDPAYLAAYQDLVAEIQAQDVGLMIIKAWRNWPEPDGHGYSTWYEHSTTRGGSGPRWPGCWRIRR